MSMRSPQTTESAGTEVLLSLWDEEASARLIAFLVVHDPFRRRGYGVWGTNGRRRSTRCLGNNKDEVH